MSTAEVVLHGRFDPGSEVVLVKTREHQLRAEGGAEVGRRQTDESGSCAFVAGVELGAFYIAVGRANQQPFEVRCRGIRDEPAPFQEATIDRPERKIPVPHRPTAQTHALRQEDVNDVPQRSDTRTGTATPLD
jgi:hypothetical protein